MSNIKLDITKAACFLEAGAVEAFEPKVKAAQQALEDGTCMGPLFPSGHRPQSHLNQSRPWALESDQHGFKS